MIHFHNCLPHTTEDGCYLFLPSLQFHFCKVLLLFKRCYFCLIWAVQINSFKISKNVILKYVYNHVKPHLLTAFTLNSLLCLLIKSTRMKNPRNLQKLVSFVFLATESYWCCQGNVLQIALVTKLVIINFWGFE